MYNMLRRWIPSSNLSTAIQTVRHRIINGCLAFTSEQGINDLKTPEQNKFQNFEYSRPLSDELSYSNARKIIRFKNNTDHDIHKRISLKANILGLSGGTVGLLVVAIV